MPNQRIDQLLEEVVEAVGASVGTFWFYHRFEDGSIRPLSVCGGDSLKDIYLLPGEGIAGQVIDKGESLIIADCQQDERWTGKVDTETGFVTKSMLCVPLKTKGLVYGSIQVLNKVNGEAFDQEDCQQMERMGQEISVLLEEEEFLRDYEPKESPEETLAKENDIQKEIVKRISNYMDQEIMHEILRKDGKHKKSLEREEIVVLFADIRGFTGLAERLTTAQLISSLSDFLHVSSRCIHKYHGIVDKFMGDCTMAYWPLEMVPNGMELACQAALEMQEKFKLFGERMERQLGYPIGVGIGIHAGPALLCHVGTEEYMAYTPIGDVVNVTSRIEDHAPAGCIYLSAEVAEQAKEFATVQELPHGISLKGKQGKFKLWQLLS